MAFFITLDENFGSLLDDNVGKETLKVGLLHWFTDSDSPFTEVVDAVIDEYGTLGCAFQNADGKKWKCEYQSYELESAREENNSPVVDADEDAEAEEVAEEEVALPAREETPSYDQLVNSNGDELDSMSDEMLEEVLKLGISQADNNMPMDLGSGLTMKSIRLQGSNLLYTVECDEDQIPVQERICYETRSRDRHRRLQRTAHRWLAGRNRDPHRGGLPFSQRRHGTERTSHMGYGSFADPCKNRHRQSP